MHFSTFLKFLTLDTGDKIRDLEAYAKPGGFDYYRSSRDAVMQHSAHGRSREQVIKDIAAAAPHNAVAHNVEIFEHTADWLEKQKGKRVVPSRGVWPSPNKVFSVHIEPEIALDVGDKTKVVAVYPRKDPRLSRDTAGAGIVLLRRSYRGTGREEFAILDAYGQRAYKSPTNISEALLDREIQTIEGELQRIMR